ncbi:Dyp-type peroxidase [Psychromicrobium lacuslunae]|uniref:Peroxidase n=1 Tax=Psychromicrobium lacuslunae TaxID=1618207 RepID=A0A0D4C0Q5_9MICC|nr:Dyp-type peroxidase [Psychromicrobium lacuslunae]AJT42124.1 peroxidase [Psychromicrobium lacuslunae]
MSERKTRLPRRHLLIGGAAAGTGALGAALIGNGLANSPNHLASAPGTASDTTFNGDARQPFYAKRQSGIETPAQAHASFVALNLNPGLRADGVRRLLKLISDDAAKLSQGTAALADMEAELAEKPANLTITFGFGPGFFQAIGKPVPASAQPLPAFNIDRLRAEYSGGDLLLQLCCDDPITLAHAQRMLLKDARSFSTVRWAQSGFRRAVGTEAAGTTMRNLFGQLDGTGNSPSGSAERERIIWGDQHTAAWHPDGTSLVLRRISMDLDKWDELDRGGREESVGRTLATGAPLTGNQEFDEPDFEAKTSLGFPVIADFSHLRRSRPDDSRQRIFRRAYNYEQLATGTGTTTSGLLFASYQASVAEQFTPIQKRLDELDLLNQWTTPIGSAVFAIPPGCAAGGFIGDFLFS